MERGAYSFGFLMLILCQAGCGRNRPEINAPDITPPSTISDLTVSALTDTSLQLTWTAPGDDGETGLATRYDIHISKGSFPNGHFPPVGILANVPAPEKAGAVQSIIAGGLEPATVYYVAMKTGDEVPNWSALSNIASMKTMEAPPPPDRTPPGTVVDLAITAVRPTAITLTWTSVGDDGMEGTASAYDVRYSTAPIDETTWDSAIEVGDEPVPRPSGRKETLMIGGLSAGAVVHIAIRVRDEAGNWSVISSSIQGMTNVARIWRIQPDGKGDAPTIQAAVSRALTLDTLLVYPGRYFVNEIYLERDLIIRSVGGRDVTILDGSSAARTILLLDVAITTATLIEGFTLTGAHTDEGYRGGAVTCRGASPTIRGNTFSHNSAQEGGALFLYTESLTSQVSTAVIESNTFWDNHAYTVGGAVGGIGNMDLTVRGNSFFDNSVTRGDGGALEMLGGHYILEDNLFFNNLSFDKGGAITVNGTGLISGNVFAHNTARGLDVGDLGAGGAIWVAELVGTIRNNTFFGNRGEGESPCGGGAILFSHGNSGLEVFDNVIAGNYGCAITLFGTQPPPRLGRNILWDNEGTFGAKDFLDGQPVFRQVPEGFGSEVLFSDPQFCNPHSDDFRVSTTSPALGMGAYPVAGCP